MGNPRTNSSDRKFQRKDPSDSNIGDNFYEFSDKKEFNNLYANRDEQITKLKE